MVLAEAALQRHRQVRDLRPHPAIASSASTSGRRSPSIGDSIIDRLDLVTMEEATESILMEHVAEPLDLRGLRLDDLGAVADDVPGGLDVRRGMKLPASSQRSGSGT